MIAWALVACTRPGDEIADRWNLFFEVESAAEDEGCDPAVTPITPELPYLGIGYARGYTADTVSVYWCESTEACDVAPWATVWVDQSTQKSLQGERGTVSITGERLCAVFWNGLEAAIDGDRIALDVHLFSGAPLTVGSSAECDALLQSVVGLSCDVTRSFEGTIVP